MKPETITGQHFKKVTGITDGRLQHWTEDGVLRSIRRGIGHPRRFTLQEAIRARLLLELIERGQSLQVARKIAGRALPAFDAKKGRPELMLLVTGTSQEYNGRTYLRKPRVEVLPVAEAIEKMSHHAGGFFLIHLGQIDATTRNLFTPESVLN